MVKNITTCYFKKLIFVLEVYQVQSFGFCNANVFFDALKLTGGGTTDTCPHVGKLIENLEPRPVVKSDLSISKSQTK